MKLLALIVLIPLNLVVCEHFSYEDVGYDFIAPEYPEDDNFGLEKRDSKYNRYYRLDKGYGSLSFKLGEADIIRYLIPNDYDKLIKDPNTKEIIVSLTITKFIALTSYVRAENQLFSAEAKFQMEWIDTRINDYNDYLKDLKYLYPEKVLHTIFGK